MNTTTTLTNADKKAIAQEFILADAAHKTKHATYKAVEAIADANKTPTGKYKKAFKEALENAGSELNQKAKALSELEIQIHDIVLAERRANTALTQSRKDERLQAIRSALGLTANDDVTSEWGSHYAKYLEIRQRTTDNCFLNGDSIVYKKDQKGELETHIKVDFSHLGELQQVTIKTGHRQSPEKSWLLIGRDIEIDCIGWGDSLSLSSYNGNDDEIVNYIYALTVALTIREVTKHYPRESFVDSINPYETVAEWLKL